MNLPFFMSNDGIDFVLKAVSMVAEHGWKLLPQVARPASSKLTADCLFEFIRLHFYLPGEPQKTSHF